MKKFLIIFSILLLMIWCSKEVNKNDVVFEEQKTSTGKLVDNSVKTEEKKIETWIDSFIPSSEEVKKEIEINESKVDLSDSWKEWITELNDVQFSPLYWHVKDCDTQWMFLHNWFIYESCWVTDKTKIIKYKFENWQPKIDKELNEEDFVVNWITEFDWKIIWISSDWIAITMNIDDLEVEWSDYLNDEIENWKWITSNWKELFVSNHTNKIFVLDKDLQLKDKFQLSLDTKLNDLQFFNWFLYWTNKCSNSIFRISNNWKSILKINLDSKDSNISKWIFIDNWFLHITWNTDKIYKVDVDTSK